MASKSINDKVQELHDQARELLLIEVERLARDIMRKNKRCKSFCMAMGSASFYDKGSRSIGDFGPLPYPKYLQQFDDFIGDWDWAYRITGEPMKIVGADGLVITDW